MTPEKEIEIIRWMKDNYPTFETDTIQVWQIVHMLNDYHESEVKKLNIPVVVGRSEQLPVSNSVCPDCNGDGQTYGVMGFSTCKLCNGKG